MLCSWKPVVWSARNIELACIEWKLYRFVGGYTEIIAAVDYDISSSEYVLLVVRCAWKSNQVGKRYMVDVPFLLQDPYKQETVYFVTGPYSCM